MATKKKLLQAAAGTAAASGGAASVPLIEDVFSTFLYRGTSNAQTITNGIDLNTHGGMVWLKSRNNDYNHRLTDTERGVGKAIEIDTSDPEETTNHCVSGSFNSDGFSIATTGTPSAVNTTSDDLVSYTFRKSEGFFDVVTWTGNGTANRKISHNLNTTVGAIVVKNLSETRPWIFYHRALGATKYMEPDNDNSAGTTSAVWYDTEPTSTEFTVGTNDSVNKNNVNYVAYVFAHNNGDGIFGENEDQDVIRCGSFTVGGSGTNVPVEQIDLGFEAQWVWIKRTDSTNAAYQEWRLTDIMRGSSNTNDGGFYTRFNTASGTAESEATSEYVYPTADGFAAYFPGNASFPGAGATYVYIAIRRGPMAAPTSASEVFDLDYGDATYGSSEAYSIFTSDILIDMFINRSGSSHYLIDRLIASPNGHYVSTNTDGAFVDGSDWRLTLHNTGVQYGSSRSEPNRPFYLWQRRPKFFDSTVFLGSGSATTQTHNLGVAPEMIWVKNVKNAASWRVYHVGLGATKSITLDNTGTPATSSIYWNDTAPTDSVFSLGSSYGVNSSGNKHVAFLFTTLSGISKCGSYTGNGSSQTINCGFSNGARFVMIKRTDANGDWWYWDTTRGIVAGDDDAAAFNGVTNTTGTDAIDPASSGFVINQETTLNANVSGGSYIFYAIA